MLLHAVVADEWGDLWDVREYRSTAHGFDVAVGYPYGHARGKAGAGGQRVIVTPPLAAFLRENSRRPFAALGRPVSTCAFIRLRKLLGISRYDGGAWFEARAADRTPLASPDPTTVPVPWEDRTPREKPAGYSDGLDAIGGE